MNNPEAYQMENDPEVMKDWMRNGPRSAAFLLVIPGTTVIGAGLGMIAGNILPFALVGFGAGLLVWGLIVGLRPRF